MLNNAIRPYCWIILLFGVSVSCSSTNESDSAVKVRLSNFPNTINTVTSKSSQAGLIQRIVFNGLLSFDKKGRAKPLLAKTLPEIVKRDSVFHIKYQIRQEAKWGDGSAITSADVEFSLKLYKCPFLPNSRMRLYLSGIQDIIKEGPREFTLVASGNVSDLGFVSGDFDIVQQLYYDEGGLLSDVSLSQVEDSVNGPNYNENVRKFVEKFTADNFKFKGQYFTGAGPYQIQKIEQGKFISLTKKSNWWGSQLAEVEKQFEAIPRKIDFININENIVALNALKNGFLDVVSDIPSNEFNQLRTSDNTSLYYFSPPKHRFIYLAINSRLSKFETLKFREAIAHLLDVESIINSIEKGHATKTIGPISPTNEYYYNGDIDPRMYNPQLSIQFLKEEGFVIKNGLWYSPGAEEPLSLMVTIRPNSVYNYVAQVFKGEAEKIGLTVNIQTLEGRLVSQKVRRHDFEITIGGLTGNPFSLNFQELFSQKSAQLGGMNYSGFGNSKSDSLLTAINHATDSLSKRTALFELQKMLYNEATILFLYFSQNKIAISKRFEESSLQISGIKPGYNVSTFKLKEDSLAD